jgi:hypothetical protein
MADPLTGAKLKLERANEHLDAFEAEGGNYLGGEFYMLVRDDSAEGTVFQLWIKEEPPPRLSVILGDCVHNLRSFLDHIAWQLVLANDETPDEKTSFPIWDRPPRDGTFRPPSCRGMSNDALALVERMQPYHEQDRAPEHVLSFIRELSNTDKHRTLNLTAASLKGIRVRLLLGPNEEVFAEHDLPSGIFRHRSQVASFPIRPDLLMTAAVKIEARGDSFLALKEPGPWGQEEPILHLLEKTYRALRYGVLPQIETLPEMR